MDRLRVRLLREAGGLGDVIRCLAVARGFREQYGPRTEIAFYALAGFEEVVRLCPDVDRIAAIRLSERRDRDAFPDPNRWPYLRSPEPWQVSADLFCPAWQHEKETQGAVTRERTELWCAAAGVRPRDFRPHVVVPAAATYRAEGWLMAHNLRQGRYVCVEPFSASPLRTWPLEQWKTLIGLIHAIGCPVVVLDAHPKRAAGLPGILAAGLPIPEVMALMAYAAASVVVDSGLLHVCGALGLPALALFGMTSGPVLCRHYPTVRPVVGTAPDGACSPPCYGFALRGRRQLEECRKTVRGCAALNGIEAEEVFARVQEMVR
jgi:ADP-heptose:LPS heptosyltransferase